MNIKKMIHKHTVLISSILITNLLMTSTAAAQEKTSGFNNKVPESIVIPDKVEARVDELRFFDGSRMFLTLIREVQ